MIKSVHKAMRLLSVLSESGSNPVSLGTLSKKAEINISTCSHLISTLEADGYAVRISQSKGYILGPAAYCLSRYQRYKGDLISVCRPVMKFLHHNLGYGICLAVIEGNNKYIVDYIDSGNIWETKSKLHTDDIYRTATGRAILTHLPQDKVYDIFKKHGPPSPADWIEVQSWEDLTDYIATHKNHTVFRTRVHNEIKNTIHIGYAAPIFKDSGCIGAVGVAVCIPCELEISFHEENTKITKLLERAAKEINNRLSFE